MDRLKKILIVAGTITVLSFSAMAADVPENTMFDGETIEYIRTVKEKGLECFAWKKKSAKKTSPSFDIQNTMLGKEAKEYIRTVREKGLDYYSGKRSAK